MFKRTVILGSMLALAMALSPLSVNADMPKGQTMNSMAVCGCGMVFTPSADTKYIEVNGKSYACCTEGCHKMASKDPAGAAKMADAAMHAMMDKASMKVAVANAMSVDEKGTHMLCGCGKEFTMDNTTMFLKAGDKSYACCTKACHEMASKDPAASAKMFEEQKAKKMSMAH